MQPLPGQRLHRPLQLEERKRLRQELEYHRPVFDLAAQPADRRCQDAAVIENHRPTELNVAGLGFAAVAPGLVDQTGFVEQLVTVEHPVLVPRRAAQTESDVHPLAPPFGDRPLPLGFHPGSERGLELIEQLRPSFAPVLPGQEVVPVEPAGAAGFGQTIFPHQREVPHGNDPRPAQTFARVAVTVAEGVELLDVPHLDARLLAHPAAQGQLEGAVAGGVEGTEGQCLQLLAAFPGAHHEHPRLFVGDRHDHRVETDRDRRVGQVGFGHWSASTFWV